MLVRICSIPLMLSEDRGSLDLLNLLHDCIHSCILYMYMFMWGVSCSALV